MELLRVNEHKLKIMLNEEDVRRFGIDRSRDNFDEPGAKHALFAVLDEAKDACGFDAAGDKMLVQLYPSRDGGCELFVTKLGLLPPPARGAVERSGRVTKASVRLAAYRFAALADLVGASRMLTSHGMSGGEVYLAEEGDYVLVLEEKSIGGITDSERLSEFGETMTARSIPYIREHGKLLLDKSAVETFAKL